jgi:hypothetical protein
MARKRHQGNGSGTVYPRKNKDGKIIGYRGSYFTPDSKRRYVSGKTKTEAQRALRKATADATGRRAPANTPKPRRAGRATPSSRTCPTPKIRPSGPKRRAPSCGRFCGIGGRATVSPQKPFDACCRAATIVANGPARKTPGRCSVTPVARETLRRWPTPHTSMPWTVPA